MTRFTFKGDVTYGFAGEPRSVAIMTENQAGFDAYAAKVTEAVNAGMQMLQAALPLIDKPTDQMNQVAQILFKTEPTPSKEDYRVIKGRLRMTLDGLKAGNLAVKIHQTVGMDAPGLLPVAPGHVRLGYISGRRSVAKPKPYQNRVARTELYYGAIHMNHEVLGDQFTGVGRHIITVIHEATHKFVNTRDYAYFHYQTMEWDKEMTKEQALANADGYAWFAFVTAANAQ